MAALRSTWLSRSAFAFTLAYVALWFVIGLFPTAPTDLDIFAWASAQIALAGHPFSVYSHPLPLHTINGTEVFLNDIPPLSLLPLTLVGLLLRLLGSPNSVPLLHAFTFAFFSVFILLYSREAVSAIERLRHHSLLGATRLATYVIFALPAVVFQSLLGYGHVEQPLEIYLLLLSFRYLSTNLLLRGGCLFGLAVLSRSTAALFALPVLFALLRRTPPAAFKFFALTTLTGLVGLLPFYLSDSSDLIRSLFTSRSTHPIYAGSIWSLLRDTPLALVGQHADIAFVALFGLLLNLYLLTQKGGFTPLRLYAGSALMGLGLLLFTKTLWPYYFFEAYVFVVIFFFARYDTARSRAWLILPPLLLSALSLIAEIGVTPFLASTLVNIEAVVMFVGLLSLGGLIIYLATHDSRPVGIIERE